MSYRKAAFGLVLISSLSTVLLWAATPADSPKVVANYGRIPLSFEANGGQSDPQVRFLARGQGYGIFLTGKEAVLSLSKPDPNVKHGLTTGKPGAGVASRFASPASKNPDPLLTDVIRLELPGSRPDAAPAGESQLPGTSNYFIGNDPSKWRTSVPTYARVRYTGVYDGVDLVYYGNQRQLEYDFVVSPHADPAQIRLRFSGARQLSLTPEGDLKVFGRHGQIVFHKPDLYQEASGKRQPVDGSFVLAANHTVQFKVGRYNPDQPLTIDPVLVYSTYLGGSDSGFEDGANAIAVNKGGEAYVAGFAYSADFPVTSNAFQKKLRSVSGNAFVTKFNPSGSALIYSTYIGGSIADLANAIAIDEAGDAYLTGTTFSYDFPVTGGAFQKTNKILQTGGTAFVTKLNSSGSALIYSTYLGSSGNDIVGDRAYAIAVDSAQNAYIAGDTPNSNFPVTSDAFETENKTTSNTAFITKLNPSGAALVYSTYLGGLCRTSGSVNPQSVANAIAVDLDGNVFVAGYTGWRDFPVTAGVFQKSYSDSYGNNSSAAFVSKINPSGSSLIYSTFLGGSGSGNGGDTAQAIAVDPAGEVYVAGKTYSADFPVTKGAFQTINKGINRTINQEEYTGFITKLNPSGSALVYSTYLGGSGSEFNAESGDGVNAIALDLAGNAYVTGETYSANFPLTRGAFQKKYKNNTYSTGTAFVTKLNSAGTGLLYSTYIGGSNGDSGNAIAVDTEDNAYVAGLTGSTDFPVTSGAFQTKSEHGGAFVTKLDLSPSTTTTLISSADPATVNTKVTFTASVSAGPGIPTGNVTFSIDGKAVTTELLNSAGQASYSTSSLAVGRHTVEAAYAGNADFATSTSPALTETIALPQLAAPIFSPAVGIYTSPQQVRLTDAITGAVIHCTTDGKTKPTTSSPLCTAPLTVDRTTTIMAIARKDGYANSVVASGTYTIHLPPRVTTEQATKVTASSATLNASVDDHDLDSTVTFAWGTSKTALTSKSSTVSLAASGSAQTVSIPVAGLQPKTTYYFQPTAKNAGGTKQGVVVSFTTE